jgi:hypothetical protein
MEKQKSQYTFPKLLSSCIYLASEAGKIIQDVFLSGNLNTIDKKSEMKEINEKTPLEILNQLAVPVGTNRNLI